jgi:hypothetical protein
MVKGFIINCKTLLFVRLSQQSKVGRMCLDDKMRNTAGLTTAWKI